MTSQNSPDCVPFDDFEKMMTGKPYVDRCCHVDAVDCWGLVVLFYRLCMNVNVHHDDSYSSGGDFVTCFNGEVSFWKDTDRPKIGDVVVAYRGSHPVHVALWWARENGSQDRPP